MSADNEDFTVLHSRMCERIKAALPMFSTVTAYKPLTGQKVDTPAALIEVVEMKPAKPISGGRLALNVEFVVHCVLSTQTENVELEVRNCAARMMSVVNNNRWGSGGMCGVPEQLAAYPGMFKPDDDGFESWVVQWDQIVHLGSEWQLPDDQPKSIYIGEAPDIGVANKDKYRGPHE